MKTSQCMHTPHLHSTLSLNNPHVDGPPDGQNAVPTPYVGLSHQAYTIQGTAPILDQLIYHTRPKCIATGALTQTTTGRTPVFIASAPTLTFDL